MYKVGPLYIEGHLINSDIYICLSIWLQKGEFANTLPRRTNIGGRKKSSKLVMKMLKRMCFSHHVYNLEVSVWEDNGVRGSGHWEHERQRCWKRTGQHDIERIEADGLSLCKEGEHGWWFWYTKMHRSIFGRILIVFVHARNHFFSNVYSTPLRSSSKNCFCGQCFVFLIVDFESLLWYKFIIMTVFDSKTRKEYEVPSNGLWAKLNYRWKLWRWGGHLGDYWSLCPMQKGFDSSYSSVNLEPPFHTAGRRLSLQQEFPMEILN